MRRIMWTALVLVAATAGLIAGSAGVEAQGILDTKHNLSALAGEGANRTPGNQEIYLSTGGVQEVCVFCHTPHGADTAVNAPLWNRAKTTVTTYQMYASPTMDSTPSNTAANMGVSLACLSCHDGTVAFDALRNLPGPGGYSTNPGSAGWTWNLGINNMSTRGITNIGAGADGTGNDDLRNDHPIAMIYNDARSPSSTSQDETTGFTPATSLLGRVFVERTGMTNPTPTVVPKLPLYGTAVADARVQCASCHDPHAKTTTFLRVDNSVGSALCRTCHKKDS
jgi:predicted CXXCH cytochrome family protein